MKRKAIAFVAVLALSISMSACGGASQPDNPSDATAPLESREPSDNPSDATTPLESGEPSDDNQQSNSQQSNNQQSANEVENASSEMMAYIVDFDAGSFSVDVDTVEWVMIPGRRADELGFTEDDGPNGFYVYNPDTVLESFPLSEDCSITVLDWYNSYESRKLSTEEFFDILKERGDKDNYSPYVLKVVDGKITQITEQYVP